MDTTNRTSRASAARLAQHRIRLTEWRSRVERMSRRDGRTSMSLAEHEWDAVHDAALESFPASDPPSWSALRVGAPRA